MPTTMPTTPPSTIKLVIATQNQSRVADIELPASFTIDALIEACQGRWSLPADRSYSIVLGRTSAQLDPSLSLSAAGVANGDELTIVPHLEAGGAAGAAPHAAERVTPSRPHTTEERTTPARADATDADDRYDRQRRIPGWDQQRVGGARVLVAGAGAIGNEVLKLLALKGVGHVTVIDMDHIEASNLSRTVLFRNTDVGRAKAEVAAVRTQALCPETACEHVVGDLEHDLGLGVVHEVDAVIGCLDNLHARVALNRAARKAGVPWINAGISATAVEVTVYGPTGPCYECGLSEGSWKELRKRYSCGEGFVKAAASQRVPTTAAVASMAADLAVLALLELLHARRAPLGEQPTREPLFGLSIGERLFLDLGTLQLSKLRVPERASCLAHADWTHRIEATVTIHETADELLAWLDENTELRAEAVVLGSDVVTSVACPSCGRCPVTDVCLRDRIPAAAELCEGCGGRCEVTSQDELRRGDRASALPLRELGVPDRQWLLVRADDQRYCVALAPVPRSWRPSRAAAPLPKFPNLKESHA